MKTTRTIAAAALLGWLASCIPGYAADSAAGQKIFESSCAACHKLKSLRRQIGNRSRNGNQGHRRGHDKAPEEAHLERRRHCQCRGVYLEQRAEIDSAVGGGQFQTASGASMRSGRHCRSAPLRRRPSGAAAGGVPFSACAEGPGRQIVLAAHHAVALAAEGFEARRDRSP